MKIAMIVPSLKQAGPVNVAFDLVTLLTNNNYLCEVLYFDENTENVHKFPCSTKRISMGQRIDFNSYDIIHTHGLRPVKYVAKHRKKSDRAKFITTVHNYVFEDFKLKYGFLKSIVGGLLYLRGCRFHDTIVTLSKDAVKYYKRYLPENKLTYIYNSRLINKSSVLTRNEIGEIEEFKSDSILIGTNSSLIKRKGIDILIQALALLPPKFKLFLCGNGSEYNVLKFLAEKIGVENRIFFAGFRDDSYRYIPFYDIFVLPSRSEGFPLGILEAAAYGKKVVCSDLPVLKEAFSDDEVAFFKVDDSIGLAKAIQSISEDNIKDTNLFSKYQKLLTPEIMMDNYVKIYRK